MEVPQSLVELIEQQIPFHAHLKVKLEAVRSDGHACTLRFPHQVAIAGPSWHAGLINTGISATGGALAMFQINLDRDRIATLNTRADFLRPARGEDLYFDAELIKAGKTIIQTRVTVRQDWSEAPIATGLAVFSILRA
ncbi:MAG: PaaI family thioesterase [Bacteroidota bacterium]